MVEKPEDRFTTSVASDFQVREERTEDLKPYLALPGVSAPRIRP